MAGESVLVESAKAVRRKPPKVRGVFERATGSNTWWIRYTDCSGREHREKAGTRGMAIDLLGKRKTEAIQGRKLPETLRRRDIPFSELVDDAAAYGLSHHALSRRCDFRAPLARKLLGARPAEAITPQEISAALDKMASEREWAAGTRNRMQAFISLAYRLGIENRKVTVNPARLVRRKRESVGRVRWLDANEESRLTAVIQDRFPSELPAFRLSLNSGMRRSEQYRLTWDCVDFERRQIALPKTKNGTVRYIPINNHAIAALLALRDRGDGTGPVMLSGRCGHGLRQGEAQRPPREWFENACKLAGIANYTWHCNRHTFASRLIMAGVPLRTVQELMGHKTIAMTCRYAHLSPQHQLDAVRRLEQWADSQVPGSAVAAAFPAVQTGTRTGTGPFDGAAEAIPEQRQTVVQ